MRLKELAAQAFPGHPGLGTLPDIEVAGIETDSRAMGPGCVFIAVRGIKQDGALFIQEALLKGAVAVVGDKTPELECTAPFILVSDAREAVARLASAFYGHPSQNLKIIGITGTNGKTTSSYILEHLLSREHKKTGVIGTVSYRFDGRELPAVETTPGPLKIQALLSRMLEKGCEYVAMEVSSHALDQKRVAGIQFLATLFTNLTQDHLDYHRTMEDYFEAKAKLFSNLDDKKLAVVNGDDLWGQKLLARTRAKTLTYGTGAAADLRAENIRFLPQSTEWDLDWRGRKIKVSSPLAGLHNVYNALGAIGVLCGLGFSPENAARNLADFAGVPGRLEAVRAGQNFSVFVDFAHTPDGLLNVLRALQEYRTQRLLVVFGCGGDRDRDKRPKMAQVASTLADFVYVTSDNPRSESPEAIAREICAGFPENFKNYAVILDRRKAIRQAFLSAREGDIVLLAGKGHERTQIVGNQSLPFSDRGEAEKILEGR